MCIAAIKAQEAAIHVVLASPTGDKGQVANFLVETGAVRAFSTSLLPYLMFMHDLMAQGLRFVGG